MASVDGKRKHKSKSGFASKRDARIAGRKALSEYENVGQVMVDRDISYADFLDLWMENDCKLTCKESTLYGYEKKIRLYLKPELGKGKNKPVIKMPKKQYKRYCRLL